MSPVLQEMRKEEQKKTHRRMAPLWESEAVLAFLIAAIIILFGLLFSPTVVDGSAFW